MFTNPKLYVKYCIFNVFFFRFYGFVEIEENCDANLLGRNWLPCCLKGFGDYTGIFLFYNKTEVLRHKIANQGK